MSETDRDRAEAWADADGWKYRSDAKAICVKAYLAGFSAALERAAQQLLMLARMRHGDADQSENEGNDDQAEAQRIDAGMMEMAAEFVVDPKTNTCECGGSGLMPLPRGMSQGFYRFMASGCVTKDDGSKWMRCSCRIAAAILKEPTT